MRKKISAKDRIIVPLDVDTLSQVKEIVEELQGAVSFFKIGLQLIFNEQAKAVLDYLQSQGGQVFLDSKLADIPNTVAKATRNMMHPAVTIFNVHASCGLETMKAAYAERGQATLIGMTVLTSISTEECERIYHQDNISQVLELAKLSIAGGAAGVVCSSEELVAIRRDEELKDIVTIVPGIRPAWASSDDQKRIFTPQKAIEAGADYLVIGRPITSPPANVGSRKKAAELIIEEIERAHAG